MPLRTAKNGSLDATGVLGARVVSMAVAAACRGKDRGDFWHNAAIGVGFPADARPHDL